ncbi:MAG: hypothetical protein ABSE73_22360 [Planctomycetota bacterium]
MRQAVLELPVPERVRIVQITVEQYQIDSIPQCLDCTKLISCEGAQNVWTKCRENPFGI